MELEWNILQDAKTTTGMSYLLGTDQSFNLIQ